MARSRQSFSRLLRFSISRRMSFCFIPVAIAMSEILKATHDRLPDPPVRFDCTKTVGSFCPVCFSYRLIICHPIDSHLPITGPISDFLIRFFIFAFLKVCPPPFKGKAPRRNSKLIALKLLGYVVLAARPKVFKVSPPLGWIVLSLFPPRQPRPAGLVVTRTTARKLKI